MIHGTEYADADGSRPRRRRRVMRSFKISEISAVDRPAQAGARAVIMKRAGGGAPTGAGPVNEPYAIMLRCEDEIDRLADVCKRDGETREQATSRLVVEGYPLMKSLARTRDLAYEAAVARMGPPPGSGPVGAALKRGAPDAGMARVERELDGLAKRRADGTGEGLADAYGAVLDTPEGRRLYAEYTDAMDAASRRA